MIRKFAMVGVAAVAALMLMSTVALSTASAQAALPYKAYGSGLKAGQVVEAFKGTTSVGKATVDASGNWSIDIQAGGAANVANGDKITFKLDGKDAAQSVTFQGGQFPAPPGLALTVAAGGGTTTPPAPAKTGNAGLFGTTGTSMALVVVLGVFAATMVAGARTATRGR
ncbi:MAG: hypothetical protein AB7G21_03085 [Dehalococcoidia bacterium]